MNKKILLTVVMVLTLATVTTTFAVAPKFLQNVEWTWEEIIEGFSVDQGTTIDFGTVTGPTTETRSYVVSNTGNVPITVEMTISMNGGTYTINPSAQQTVPVDSTRTFTVDFHITAEGSATVNIHQI